jgi:endonuclease YncB( thermonuclease family)
MDALPPHNTYDIVFERVIDGDTFKAEVAIWPNFFVEASIRLKGINAPELHGQCDNETRTAEAAKASLNSLLSTATKITITEVSRDKFGGRYDARVLIPGVFAPITDVSGAMLNTGLVIKYGAPKPWCPSVTTPSTKAAPTTYKPVQNLGADSGGAQGRFESDSIIVNDKLYYPRPCGARD